MKMRFFYLVLLALMLVFTYCSHFLPQPASTAMSVAISETQVPSYTTTIRSLLAFTEMPVPSFTPTVSNTPAPSFTPTPPPTKTSTPQPEWVSRFSQPILTAIDSRQPNFQDDFEDETGGWQREDWCGAFRMQYQEGALVLTSCGAKRAHMDYPDFVVKLDGRFLPDIETEACWGIFFRERDRPGYLFSVNYDGSVSIGGFERELLIASAALAGYEINHLMIIAKGSEFAFYVNEKPLYYVNDSQYRWGNIWFRAYAGGVANVNKYPIRVAFDNFKIWDIQDISVP